LSPYHKSILLSASTGGEAVNLSWQPYEIENKEVNFVSYIIYRSSHSQGLSPIDTIAGNNTKYNDKQPQALENRMYYRVAGLKRQL